MPCRCAERRKIIRDAASNVSSGNVASLAPAARQIAASLAADAKDASARIRSLIVRK